jgi:hypothetical protein
MPQIRIGNTGKRFQIRVIRVNPRQILFTATASKHFHVTLWKNLWTTSHKTYELLEALDF